MVPVAVGVSYLITFVHQRGRLFVSQRGESFVYGLGSETSAMLSARMYVRIARVASLVRQFLCVPQVELSSIRCFGAQPVTAIVWPPDRPANPLKWCS